MAKRLYRHRKYAGSPGDVWKHFIFLDFLSRLKDEKINLIDTHGGDGFYPLHYGASWKRGYGLLKEEDILALELANHPYFKYQQDFFHNKKTYLGFWALCSELLKDGHSFNLDVYENQAEVYKDCLKFSDKYRVEPSIEIFNDSCENADFSNYDIAFIDPTYRRKDEQGDDWLKVIDLCKSLEANDCDYMLWYPVYNKKLSFKLWEKLDAISLEASWVANEHFKFASSGSGILISKRLFQKISPNVGLYKHLAELLHAKLSLHK